MEMHRPLRSGRPLHSRREVLRTMGITAAAGLLVSCGGDDDDSADDDGGGGGGVGGNFPDTPEWNFVFINHVTTNPFFVPTQYGIEDASALLGTKFQWTGSETRRQRRDGQRLRGGDRRQRRRDRGGDRRPRGVQRSDRARPGGRDPGRLVQRRRAERPSRLHRAGPVRIRLRDGQADRRARRRGRGCVVHRHARPAQHPTPHRRRDRRHRGVRRADQRRPTSPRAPRSKRSSTRSRRTTSATPAWRGCSPSTPAARRRRPGRARPHDARAAGLKGCGGYDLLPTTVELVSDGVLDFTIDQQPYLQGFLPVQYLYLSKLSGGVVHPAGDQHRSGVPRLDVGEAVPRHVEPLRGRRRGAEDRRASRLSDRRAMTETIESRRTTATGRPAEAPPGRGQVVRARGERPDRPAARGEHRLRRRRAVRVLRGHRRRRS